MRIRARLGGAAAAAALVIASVVVPVGPALGQAAPPPTIPILGPLLDLLSPLTQPPPPPAPPPTAAPAPPSAPGLPAGSGSGRRIVYCVRCQRVWLVEANGSVVQSHLVSGRAGVPRPGTYRVFSKSERAIAGSRKATMRNMVRFARGRTLAIGFHSIPRDLRGRPIQAESDLGNFRSLGCVRQTDSNARILYNFAPLGTTVVVV
ncbi:MAG TPA: L,D-transpeptidase [Acidimicrobiales bacterium]|nr:L,D-transpeptidase [Acidimicrobiales bacterium]